MFSSRISIVQIQKVVGLFEQWYSFYAADVVENIVERLSTLSTWNEELHIKIEWKTFEDSDRFIWRTEIIRDIFVISQVHKLFKIEQILQFCKQLCKEEADFCLTVHCIY